MHGYTQKTNSSNVPLSSECDGKNKQNIKIRGYSAEKSKCFPFNIAPFIFSSSYTEFSCLFFVPV